MANSQLSGIIEKVFHHLFRTKLTFDFDDYIHFSYVNNVQMTGKDKDYRYMATSDLLNELNKDSFKLDSDLEMRLSSIILQQLDDVAGDVSGLAVKWLAFFSLHLWFSLSSVSDSWCVSFAPVLLHW